MKYLLGILLLVGFVALLNVGIAKAEKVECNTWQEQAKEIPIFTAAAWQIEQCSNHDISIITE